MAQSFYFYDLETSGFSPRQARIMQFAGQRTNLKLEPIGGPDNILVKLSKDILPEPDAVLVHGISPRLTQGQGISEPELAYYLTSKVFTPDTIAVGFNNIRFDDEFIRFTFWRNFYDAYEWQWKDGRSKWDMLDASRMVRALRPAGIEWPFGPNGKVSNRLELLSSINKIQHDAVHDALSDVNAMIAFARLIKSAQPKLFAYMVKMRDKKEVNQLVSAGEPFIYVSGRYPSEYEKASIVVKLASQPDDRGAYVYDLRQDPSEFINLSVAQLAKLWKDRRPEAKYFPVKTLGYNKCPAVAPLSTLDEDSAKRIKVDMTQINKHLLMIREASDFGRKVSEADNLIRPKAQPSMMVDEQKVDDLLYESFIENSDRPKMNAVRNATATKLKSFQPEFKDERLKVLLPIYKARNYPEILSLEEAAWWQKYRFQRLVAGGRYEQFQKRLEEITKNYPSEAEKNLAKELADYAKSTVPLSS